MNTNPIHEVGEGFGDEDVKAAVAEAGFGVVS